MFRKLFISLLILSALASEGIYSFPVNFYNMYLADINKLDFCEDSKSGIQEQLNIEAFTGLSYKPSLVGNGEGLFVLSSNTSELLSKIREFNTVCSDTSYLTQYKFKDEAQFVSLPSIDKSIKKLKDIIIISSDNSPPTL